VCKQFVDCLESKCETNLTSCFGADYAMGTITGECASFETCATQMECSSAAGVSCAEKTSSECRGCVQGLVACAVTSCLRQFDTCENGLLHGLHNSRDAALDASMSDARGEMRDASISDVVEEGSASDAPSSDSSSDASHVGDVCVVLGAGSCLGLAPGSSGIWAEVSALPVGGGVETNSLMLVSPSGLLKTFPMPQGTYLSDPNIAATPPRAASDGSVWFLYSTAVDGGFPGPPLVGHMTAAGALESFAIPYLSLENLLVGGIAFGSDGNLWFTVNGQTPTSNPNIYVGKMTAAGAVTTFLLPNQGCDPVSETLTGTPPYNCHLGEIAVGPDGALWFSEEQITPGVPGSAVGLGRVTLAGAFTFFQTAPNPGAGSSIDVAQPSNLFAGPDGELWFLNGSVNVMGKMTTGGSVTGFTPPIYDGDSGLVNLREVEAFAPGSDGNIWYTADTPTPVWLADLTTAGVFNPPIAVSSVKGALPSQFGLVLGLDGKLWYAFRAPPEAGATLVTQLCSFSVAPSGD
jgi:streptogramin lyase